MIDNLGDYGSMTTTASETKDEKTPSNSPSKLLTSPSKRDKVIQKWRDSLTPRYATLKASDLDPWCGSGSGSDLKSRKYPKNFFFLNPHKN